MKEKIIWLNCDAFSTYLTGDLSKYSNFSAFYHIKNFGYPQSAAIASTQFLGRASRNYVGNLLTDETIIDQLSTFPFSAVGTDFPILSVLGDSRFADVKHEKGREDYPLGRINYNSAFPSSSPQTGQVSYLSEANKVVTDTSEKILSTIDINQVHSLLNHWTKYAKHNFLCYTTIMDSYNHNYAGLDPITIEGASLLLANIKAVIQALEQSNYKYEYILVVSSDHGGQLYFGEDEICNHGCQMDKSNEGFLYIYSFGTGEAEDWISNEDVAPIIAGYVRNAAIPKRATGWPRPIKDAAELRWNSWKMKEFQLRSLLGVDENKEIESEEEYLRYLKGLEKEIGVKDRALGWYLGIGIASLVVLGKMWREVGWEMGWMVFEHFFVFFFVYGGRRVEKVLYWPVICANGLNMMIEIYGNPMITTLKDDFSYRFLRQKTFQYLKSNPGVLVSILNLYFLLTQPDKYITVQVYHYYYIHYFLILSTFLIYYSKIQSIFKYLLSSFTILLLSLMLLYEHITDYSMTDQTPSMILTARLFYILLSTFTILITLLPHPCNKKQLLSIPLILIYFFIATQAQRSYFCCFFLPAAYFLMTHDKVKDLLLLGISSYLAMLGTFGFDISLRAGNHSWGVNPDEFPIFTGFLFGVHKLAWLMLSGCGIMGCVGFEKYFSGLVLRGFLAVGVFLYVFYEEPAASLSVFMWCMGQNLTLIVSHSLGIVPEFRFRRLRVKPLVMQI